MKSSLYMILFFFIVNFQSFADIGDCMSLSGDYSCQYAGEEIPLKVKLSEKDSSLLVDIGSEGGEYVIDGNEYSTPGELTTYIGYCRENGQLELENFYKGELEGQVVFQPLSEREIVYSLKKFRSEGEQLLQLECSKL